ncbi:GGDEF domain-containing protein [Ferdinandcohnia sp. Marseille-Q9671]
MKRFNTEDYSFADLKIKTYKFMIPVLIIASLFGIFLDYINEFESIYNRYALPTIMAWLLLMNFLIFKLSSRHFRYIEYVTFVFGSILFLGKFYVTIHYEFGVNGLNTFGEFFDWIPLLFIFNFFTFNGKRALTVSLLFLISTLLIAIDYVVSHDFDRLSVSPIVQFHFSNIVYVIALYFLQRLKEALLDANALKKSSNTDFLTELPNRRYMHNLLLIELKKKDKLSVILFDVDDFKKINDRYGHDIGDAVLIKISECVKSFLADKGLLGRWGGEEFLIILPNMSVSEASEIAEGIRLLLEQTTVEKVGIVTSSFGVTELRNNEAIHLLLNRADKALYEAKDYGKNQIRVR